MVELKRKVALITGGNRGIGRAIACRLAADGMVIALTYAHQRDAADATARDVLAAGAPSVHVFHADMADPQAVSELPDKVVAECKSLDILINNAGVARDGMFMTLPEADWRYVLEVNLFNALRLTERALPHLAVSGGRVITVSSLAGRVGKDGQVPYSTSKGGLIGMTRLIARVCASKGVLATAVAPGFIETQMIERVPEKAIRSILRGTADGRQGQPKEVADVCAFLASSGASYINGAVLPIDGGFRV